MRIREKKTKELSSSVHTKPPEDFAVPTDASTSSGSQKGRCNSTTIWKKSWNGLYVSSRRTYRRRRHRVVVGEFCQKNTQSHDQRQK